MSEWVGGWVGGWGWFNYWNKLKVKKGRNIYRYISMDEPIETLQGGRN